MSEPAPVADAATVRRVAAEDPLFAEALDAARDWRGDVTIELTDGSAVEGFLYDRTQGGSAADRRVRLLPRDGGPRVTLQEDRIRALAFTGKDAAAGKSWESWVRRYAEKRLKGESASLESETLD